jgi:hypothetical protein
VLVVAAERDPARGVHADVPVDGVAAGAAVELGCVRSRVTSGADVRVRVTVARARRLALFLQESLFRGTQWVVFEPNGEPLWAQIRLYVGAFMNDLFRQGAFQGKSPHEAYFIRCDRTTMTQQDIDRGIVTIEIGFAPLEPAEFVVLRIQQIANELATWALPDLDANANAVALESIKLENEGWERDSEVAEPAEIQFTKPP